MPRSFVHSRRRIGPREHLVAHRAHRVLASGADQAERGVEVLDLEREPLRGAQVGE
jgi:hypothetical protein